MFIESLNVDIFMNNISLVFLITFEQLHYTISDFSYVADVLAHIQDQFGRNTKRNNSNRIPFYLF